MLKKIILIVFVFFLNNLVSGEDIPETRLKKAKFFCEKKIREANKELIKAKKNRNKEIKTAIKEYDAAIEKVKIHYTKQEELQKALSFKEMQEELGRQSILEFITSDPVKKPQPENTANDDNNESDTTTDVDDPEDITAAVIKPPVNDTPPVVKEPVKDDDIEFAYADKPKKQPEVTHNNTVEVEKKTPTDNINLGLGEVVKSLSSNSQSLKDYGYSVNGSCINGPLLEGNERLFISTNTYKFNGKCEYCFKIKARWYHGILLTINDKLYYMSYGNWANNGTKIVTNGELEETNDRGKIIAKDQEETKLKGQEYKVPRFSKDWNEVKIVIDNGNISYIYNGNEIHKEAVNIPKGSELQFGFSTYRCETELKDFSLKL